MRPETCCRRVRGETPASKPEPTPATLSPYFTAIAEGDYLARLIAPTNCGEVEAYQQLRYDCFVRQRGWVAPDPLKPGREADGYDAHAWHLAVFDSDAGSYAAAAPIAAYLRAVPWTAPCGFMLDREFSRLASAGEMSLLPRDKAVELSRLVVAPAACAPPESRSGPDSPHVIEILLKLLYRLSLEAGIERYYVVVEAPWLRAFTRRFRLPFQTIGRPCTFPDGTATVAAYTTRTDLERSVAAHDPERYRWYREGLPDAPMDP